MYRLKNRQTGIPQAIRFHQPELKWTSRPGSFENIVRQIISVRLANPHHLKKHGWATDYESVANELDGYLAKVCLDNGWTKYVQAGEGDSPPPTQARPGLHRSAGNVAGGMLTNVLWLSSGAEAVSQQVSSDRAQVCKSCPNNSKGDLLSFFTVPAANAIRAALNLKRQWKLSTPVDEHLHVCGICSCPLKLKVHFPIQTILDNIQADVLQQLPDFCWIRKEADK